ncbi:MAG: hypothetical protein L0G99_01055 [Propionibacteriales bacterium]|nr:hypothetical protein [Propionibacteriales bacterium]
MTWEPEDRWIKGQLDFPTTTRVAVLSRTPLSGVVDVESHRVSWRSGSSKGASTLNEDEVLLPAGQFRPAGAGVGIAVVAACIVIPVGFGLLVSWVGTRHTHRLYKKAVDKAPEGPSGG